MATLTLKNVPDDVLERLKTRAERQGRSVNREAIAILGAAVQPATPVDTEALLARLRATRVTLRGKPLSNEELTRYKREGRL
ncbi:MAG TPA: Arc family DNA-binding protein [Candidatus Sulfotelmatobacter sp.]|nr:Arc family DNA-binding protein [Candidatus Sulfotelmatobacter sp.]